MPTKDDTPQFEKDAKATRDSVLANLILGKRKDAEAATLGSGNPQNDAARRAAAMKKGGTVKKFANGGYLTQPDQSDPRAAKEVKGYAKGGYAAAVPDKKDGLAQKETKGSGVQKYANGGAVFGKKMGGGLTGAARDANNLPLSDKGSNPEMVPKGWKANQNNGNSAVLVGAKKPKSGVAYDTPFMSKEGTSKMVKASSKPISVNMKSGGSVPSRGDGAATKGRTRGRMF